MKRVWTRIGLVASFAIAVSTLAPAAQAVSIAVDLGTGAPPALLGGFTMTAFPADPQPAGYAAVSSVASPLGGAVVFSEDHFHAIVPSDWSSWSHGYTGDVYWTGGPTTSTFALPVGTAAFYFYAEPEPFEVFSITATSSDGTFLTVDVDGYGGANGFGFYDAIGLASITVSSDVSFAVGEFGIAPEPSTVLLLGAGLGALGLRRLRRS